MALFRKTKVKDVASEIKNSITDNKTGIFFNTENDDVVTYGNVTGFFVFRGELYVKVDAKTSARKVSDFSVSFMQDIKNVFPEEFAKATNMVISKLLVQPVSIKEIKM